MLEVAPVAAAAAAEIGKAKRERYVTAAEVAAAADMEEISEARLGEAPAEEVEEPEVSQGYERTMMRICPPCPFRTGKTRVLS